MTKVVFNEIFQAANESKCRYKLLMGSAGSGKSTNTAMDYILKLSRQEYKGANLLVVRSAEVSHLNSTYAELSAAIDRMNMNGIYEKKLNPLSITCKTTGAEVIFRGCNDAAALERLKSVTVKQGKLCWVWLEEAVPELEFNEFQYIDDRLRGKLPNNLYYQITCTFNPVNVNSWLKRHYWDYDSEEIFKCKSTYLDNIFIDGAYHRRMERRKDIDPEGYRVFGLGEWGETSGLIFPNIEIGDYLNGSYDSFSGGIDWGWNHPSVVLAVAFKDGDIYALKEVVCREKTTAEIIKLCEKEGIPKDITFFADSAEPDRIREFQRAGFRVLPVKKEKGISNNFVYNGIQWLKQRKIFVDGRCPNLIRELQSYKWKKDPRTGEYLDEPVAINDDCIAALRYASSPMKNVLKFQSIPKEALGF